MESESDYNNSQSYNPNILQFEDSLADYDEFDQPSTELIPRGYIKRAKDGNTLKDDKIVIKLRACISCRLILSEEQFFENGCGNCSHLQMDGDRRRMLDCTSANFSGLISIMDPKKSWAAKYNNLTNVIPGCYAIIVAGQLPESDDL